jgi:hypothetical protein
MCLSERPGISFGLSPGTIDAELGDFADSSVSHLYMNFLWLKADKPEKGLDARNSKDRESPTDRNNPTDEEQESTD